MNFQLIRKPIDAVTEAERQQIFKLLAQHYVDPTDLLDREYVKNNQLYLAWIQDQLAGVFMVGYHEAFPIPPYTTDIFLGISGTDYRFKGKKIGKLLYLSHLLDAAHFEQAENKRVLHWWTTASPLVYRAIHKLYARLVPDRHGDLPAVALPYITHIKETYHYHGLPGNHPDYVLRQIAVNTHYRPEQEAYLADIYNEHDLPVLTKHAINEPAGDRILVLCETPHADRLRELQQEWDTLVQHLQAEG
jgi:hypothetical protein